MRSSKLFKYLSTSHKSEWWPDNKIALSNSAMLSNDGGTKWMIQTWPKANEESIESRFVLLVTLLNISVLLCSSKELHLNYSQSANQLL